MYIDSASDHMAHEVTPGSLLTVAHDLSIEGCAQQAMYAQSGVIRPCAMSCFLMSSRIMEQKSTIAKNGLGRGFKSDVHSSETSSEVLLDERC
jgi:hypothetical protein